MRQQTKKLVVVLVATYLLVILFSGASHAQSKEFKLGVLYSLTGAFAPAGALAGYRGTMVAVDIINARGGIAGEYKVVPVVADAQSNPDVAIREGQRLMTIENVPVVLGVFSSSIAVPLAPMAEKKQKNILGNYSHFGQSLGGSPPELCVSRHANGIPVRQDQR